MLFIPRHLEIISIISKLKKVTVQELTKRLGVSEVTIRKDLSLLEEKGKLIRTHGGAVLAEDNNLVHTISLRWEENLEQKKALARCARALINEGDTIFIDAGSTCFFLACEIREMNLRVITNSLNVLIELSSAPGINLHAVGGSYRQEAGSFIGPVAIETIKNFQVENCFLGATGFSDNGIFSAQNIIESRLKAAVLQVAQRKIVLCDSSKYRRKAFSVFARAKEIDILVTDPAFPDREKFQSLGIEVINPSVME